MLPSAPMSDIEARIATVRERIAAAAERAGREPEEVGLMAVSKTFPPRRVREAIVAGITLLGENRVQEAEEKIPLVEGAARWHLVGKLQSNKARLAAALFDGIQSIDRPSLVEKLDRAAERQGTRLDAWVQADYGRVDADEEEVGERVAGLCRAVHATSSLQLRGLMILPPYDPDAERARPWFRRLRELRDRIREENPELPLEGLSMGMTNDFEIAVEEGATLVRVGTAIFGERDG